MFNFQLSRCRDLNSGPLPYQGSALPLSYIGIYSWSGRRGSNSRPSAWKADALSTELLPHFLWAKMDSNHRRRKPADLQSAPFGHSGICPYISLYKTLNLHLPPLYHTHLSFSEECTRLSKIESVRNGCKFRH